jgi:hypothetical protein
MQLAGQRIKLNQPIHGILADSWSRERLYRHC